MCSNWGKSLGRANFALLTHGFCYVILSSFSVKKIYIFLLQGMALLFWLQTLSTGQTGQRKNMFGQKSSRMDTLTTKPFPQLVSRHGCLHTSLTYFAEIPIGRTCQTLMYTLWNLRLRCVKTLSLMRCDTVIFSIYECLFVTPVSACWTPHGCLYIPPGHLLQHTLKQRDGKYKSEL